MRVIGCDTGSEGALYELVHDGSGWVPGDYLVMPMVDVGKRIRQVDVPAVADWLAARPTRVTLLVIEEVGYMPSGDSGGETNSGFSGGAFSSAILSGRYNRIVGMLQTLRTVPFNEARPQTWQAKLKIKVARIKGEKRDKRKKRVKAAIAAMIRERYPTAALVPPRCRVPHGGLVDALAIAHYATILAAENALVPAAPTTVPEALR